MKRVLTALVAIRIVKALCPESAADGNGIVRRKLILQKISIPQALPHHLQQFATNAVNTLFIMTASYFCHSLQDEDLQMRVAKEVLLSYAEDLELVASSNRTFLRVADLGW